MMASSVMVVAAAALRALPLLANGQFDRLRGLPNANANSRS
jgi:hypothetical protein